MLLPLLQNNLLGSSVVVAVRRMRFKLRADFQRFWLKLSSRG